MSADIFDKTCCLLQYHKPPSLDYHRALAAAQDDVLPMLKNEKGGHNKMYSKVESWIRLKTHLRKHGLLAKQLGGMSVDRSTGPMLRVQFALELVADGTGEIFTYEWALTGTKQTPGDATATAYTRTWKAFLRGLLMVDQVDDDEEFERGAHERREELDEQPEPPPPRQAPRQAQRQQPAPRRAREQDVEGRATATAGAVGLKPGDAHDFAPPPLVAEPTGEELLMIGWWPGFVEPVVAIGADAPITPEIKSALFQAASEWFAQDPNPTEAFKLAWAGTGFAPQGAGGPQPTGSQIRRLMGKFDWTTRGQPVAQ